MPRKGSINVNLIDRRFGRLVVDKYAGQSKRNACWLCRCDCGGLLIVIGHNLTGGNTQSCGCLRVDMLRARTRTHGHAPLHAPRSPTYQSWTAMRSRCMSRRPNDRRALDYGLRGITCCVRWNSFEAFLADMGERPAGTSLDRVDVNGNYEPSNCRWATAAQQTRNRRTEVQTAIDRVVARSRASGTL